MASPGPATPVGHVNGLQVMSPTSAAGDGQNDYGPGDVAGQDGGAPRALLNGVMSPSEAAQREARARTAEQSPGATDGGEWSPECLGLVSAPASPQALHPLMEQPTEFQGQLHPFASGASTAPGRGYNGSGWTAAVRLMGRFVRGRRFEWLHSKGAGARRSSTPSSGCSGRPESSSSGVGGGEPTPEACRLHPKAVRHRVCEDYLRMIGLHSSCSQDYLDVIGLRSSCSQDYLDVIGLRSSCTKLQP